MSDVSEQMRADWNQRAREDAHYYVAFGGRNQDEDGFLATAAQVVTSLEWELKRLPREANRRSWRALEIGCGPGRLLKPMSRHFGEIHGVDVSDEMIALARQRLQSIPHAHAHATNGASLALFADESFDLVYSYAVFQHVPSRDVVLEYMRETQRVLKPGGIFRAQFNGLSPTDQPDTWHGISFSPQDIRDFTGAHGLQLLALEGVHTQYMWTTWRKAASGDAPERSGQTAIRRIANAATSEPLAPQSGPFAALSLMVQHLPPAADLNSLHVAIDARNATLVFVGPEDSGLQQVNVMLPEGTRSGLVPVDLRYRGEALCPAAYVRVIPTGPPVPRVLAVTDGIHIVEENRTRSGIVKVQLQEVLHSELIAADIDGVPVKNLEVFRTDPLHPRHEVNFQIPDGLAPGRHELRIHIGRRLLMPRELTIIA
jgi:SAM-dependent methyltransferase